MADLRFAHIVNIYSAAPGSPAALAQDVTLAALRIARDFASSTLDVGLYAAVFPDEQALVPDFFSRSVPLARSIMDCTDRHNGRRLPLLADILAGVYAASEADHLVFSNNDIAPMPYFYPSLAHIAAQGHDAFIVTRRTIHAPYRCSGDLPLMYAEAGTAHPGCDCFVFRRNLLEKMRLGRVAVGGEFVALALRANLAAVANNMKIFRDLHLTFHLGDERAWMQYTDDASFNAMEVDDIFRQLLAAESVLPRKDVLDLHDDFQQRKQRLRIRIGKA